MSTLTPADVAATVFETVRFREGYDQVEVDDFLDECFAGLTDRITRLARRDTSGSLSVGLTGADVHARLFRSTRLREGYDQQQVDEFMTRVQVRLDELDRELTERGVTVTHS